MNEERRKQRMDEVLTGILRAISTHGPLRDALVFKGTRILNLHLGTLRRSLDIDTNLRVEFQREIPDLASQIAWFEDHLARAIRNHFEDQEPVRYLLDSVRVEKNPECGPHPCGWDGWLAKIRVTDQKERGVRSLPTLELDIAAPENLGPDAVCELSLGGITVNAYALHRIAGEKLRAFLSSLSAYRRKINSPPRAVRAKDLHDLARILEARPIDDAEFWSKAAHEFKLACESRLVDCQVSATFREEWGTTQAAYESDPNLTSVPWADAERALYKILDFLSRHSVFPLRFPLEQSGTGPS